MKNKRKFFFTMILVGILWFFMNSPTLADSGSSSYTFTPDHTYYGQTLTPPAQIQAVNGLLEATISIDYNISPTSNPTWGTNGTATKDYPSLTLPYEPSNSASNATSIIGQDKVALRNYTIKKVQHGKFKGKDSIVKKPNGDSSTWVTDLIGPTLRAKPGDQIILHLTNNLPDDKYIGYSTATDNGFTGSEQDYFDAGFTSCIDTSKNPEDPNNPDADQKGMLSNATCNMTNFHTHGLHDSPGDIVKATGEFASSTGTDTKYTNERDYWVSDDVIDSLMPGGDTWDIKIQIPEIHPAGTFWYHPHQHGATSVALASGLEGAIIIDDIAPTIIDDQTAKSIPTLDGLLAKQGIKDRLMMFSHLPYEAPDGKSDCTTDRPCEVGWSINGAADANFAGQVFTGYTLVNGQVYPEITMNAGDIERWRLINGGVAEPISLQIVKLTSTGETTLDSILDQLTAPNRLPFITTAGAPPKPTNLEDVVIGGIVYPDSDSPSYPSYKPDQFLKDTDNKYFDSTDPLPWNIIAYDGITIGQIDTSGEAGANCPTDNTGGELPNCVSLAPGNRVDTLVNPTETGTYLLIKNPNWSYLSNNGAATAEDIVAVLTVKDDGSGNTQSMPTDAQLAAYGKQQYYKPFKKHGKEIIQPSIAAATPFAEYEAHFLFFPAPGTGVAPSNKDTVEDDSGSQVPETSINPINFGMSFSCKNNARTSFTECNAKNYKGKGKSSDLDKEMFTENIRPITLPLGRVGEWTLKVEYKSGIVSAHPFHIHTNPFFIMKVETFEKSDGSGENKGYTPNSTPYVTYPRRWQDTLLIQPNQIVTFRYQPLDYEGSFVFHCHFVDHEDQGMMRWVKVCAENNKTCRSDNTYGLLPDFTNENF